MRKLLFRLCDNAAYRAVFLNPELPADLLQTQAAFFPGNIHSHVTRFVRPTPFAFFQTLFFNLVALAYDLFYFVDCRRKQSRLGYLFITLQLVVGFLDPINEITGAKKGCEIFLAEEISYFAGIFTANEIFILSSRPLLFLENMANKNSLYSQSHFFAEEI